MTSKQITSKRLHSGDLDFVGHEFASPEPRFHLICPISRRQSNVILSQFLYSRFRCGPDGDGELVRRFSY